MHSLKKEIYYGKKQESCAAKKQSSTEEQQACFRATVSAANALKLDSQIGNSNTNSLSRQQYLETVEAIEADTEMSEEEKEAALQEANETVVLDSSRQASGLRMLEEIRQWNEDHPDEEPKVVRGHVLAWHGGQQPNYFFCEGFYYDSSKTLAEQAVDEETMLARLDNYIRQMMEVYSEYNDIIVAWDVVNEAIDDYTGQRASSTWFATRYLRCLKQYNSWFPTGRQKTDKQFLQRRCARRAV